MIERFTGKELTGRSAKKSFESSVQDVSTLFKTRLLSIAVRQRPYEWTDIEMETLLNDVCSAWSRDEDIYFLGSVLLKKVDDDISSRSSIIDGQQRLTSICIILAAIRKLLIPENNNEGEDIQQDKSNITILMRGTEDKTRSKYLIKLENDENNKFFDSFIMCEDTSNLIPHDIQKGKIDSKIEELSDILDTISSKNMAKNYMKSLCFLRKHVNGNTLLKNLYSFVKYGCSFIVTTIINETDEWLIFNTINNRGRELSSMDTAKREFISLYKGKNLEQSLKEWNEVYQSLGEDDFSLLFECMYVKIGKVTIGKTSSTQRSFGEIFEVWGNDSFYENCLQPLYIALEMIKTQLFTTYLPVKTEGSNSALLKELEMFNYINNSFSQNAKQNSTSSYVIMVLLVAIYNAIASGNPLLSFKKILESDTFVWKVNKEEVVQLMHKWNAYLLNISISESSVNFEEIITVIKNILENDKNVSESINMLTFNSGSQSQIEQILKRQDEIEYLDEGEGEARLLPFWVEEHEDGYFHK